MDLIITLPANITHFYVLMKARDGHVYANYVGTSYGDDYHWAIWVPKVLVANKRGPDEKWGRKNKL